MATPYDRIAGGAIRTAVRTIRRLTDQPAERAKYRDADILEIMNEAYPTILRELYDVAETKPVARVTVTLTGGTEYYQLPPTVGEIQRLVHRNSDGTVDWEIVPRAGLNPWGPRVVFEGARRFRLLPYGTSSSDTDEVDVEFVPSGDIVLQVGRCSASGASSSQITMGLLDDRTGTAEPYILGAADQRPNAYVGCLLNVWAFEQPGAFPVGYAVYPQQERLIHTHSVATGVVTVKPDFDFDLSAVNPFQPDPPFDPPRHHLYEIYPMECPLLWPCITKYVALQIAMNETNKDKVIMLERSYAQSKGSCALLLASYQSRAPQSMETDTVDNPDSYGWD